MTKIKRRGKTFCTEHYLDDDLRAKLYTVATEALTYLIANHDFKWYSDEMHVWFCPRGIYLAKDDKPTVNWNDLDLPEDLIVGVLAGMMKAFKKYGGDCPKTHHFRILLTDGDFVDIVNMLNL